MRLLLAIALILLASGCTAPAADLPAGSGSPQAPPPNQTLPPAPEGIPDDGLDDALAELEQTEDLIPGIRTFSVTARQWAFTPSTIEVLRGDTVILEVRSIDVLHGLWLPDFNISEQLLPGQAVRVQFVADRAGVFPIICSVFCGEGHAGMRAQLIVREA